VDSTRSLSVPRLIRFGVFEVDLSSRELRKNGVLIKLQEQPFQILTALLEHPGEMVAREEIRKRLWPADTFVDFDNGVNAAVNRLREALAIRRRIHALFRLSPSAATGSSPRRTQVMVRILRRGALRPRSRKPGGGPERLVSSCVRDS
jgi:hypothetical protein